MIAHCGCFEDVTAVIDLCSSSSVLCAVCLSFEVEHLFSGKSVLWDQRVTACLLFLTPLFSHSENNCHTLVRTQVLQKPFELLCSQNFGVRGK